jgi:hypothetical protein
MRQSYGNEKGIGFFFPEENAVVSGVITVHGLAYLNEGWLEEGRGVGSVTMRVDDGAPMPARAYVKGRYWIRTLDTAGLCDGPHRLRVTAHALDGALIGHADSTLIVDSSRAPAGRRLIVSPDGGPDGSGAADSPLDPASALARAEPADVLCFTGGTYTTDLVVSRSGRPGAPITIMNHAGAPVMLEGAGIKVLPDVAHVAIMGIDQRGLRFGACGVELGESIRHVELWDCSFAGNTHPYESVEPNEMMAYGYGLQALTVRGREDGRVTSWAIEGRNRQFITVSHCDARGNDAGGFDLSSIDHGRFQFLEASWNPDHKSKDILQYKHADGFTIKNSEYEPWGFPSEDCVFLFCRSHHNGQDGFDLRSPHVRLFGCVSHDEAACGVPYGGSGIKTWEYDYKFSNCVSFRNNITDRSGYGLEAGNNSFICNCLFSDTFEYAVTRPDDDPRVRRIFSHNNIFVDCTRGFGYPVRSYTSIWHGRCDPRTLLGAVPADPRLPRTALGDFFPSADSPQLHGGCATGFSFMVDGVDLMERDGLGRPRAHADEIGPYTRYD